MAARLFQSILLEIKNKIPFILGIVDATGNIISCTELRFIGENVEAAEEFFASGMDEGECGGYTFRKLDGCDVQQLADIKDKFGSIDKEKAIALGYEVLPGDAWLTQDVDILIPAALENQITPANFGSISKQVKILCEAANGPTTPDCDKLIQDAGIMLIPDFLCNAGGVTCSYFEQVQCNMNYFWSKEEVLQKLETAMTKAFQGVYELAEEKKLYMRDAAYVIAINRVVNAVKTRGWV